ncbi:Growth hormone receptor [Triplophysa tibetana]|uniref:Growth hormone receptor n=1 Tax=Triplophysa tibetana TaxID=1572043 RepID=A0A5A9PKM5_9TELE|nr:Growth hormone receptor [Triplophysa tibetana]
MMLFVLLTIHWTTLVTALHESRRTTGRQHDVVLPIIYKCRSPNMEVFTCHWKPLDREENVTYTFLYTLEYDNKSHMHTKGMKSNESMMCQNDVFKECPDYVTAGPNSCHFDTKHTQVWQVYCMNVTAHTRSGPITSPTKCYDVVDLVETDPPFNLSYSMLNKTGDESGHIFLVSWLYPIGLDVKTGWLTLEYELRYRHLSEPDEWKVKERLRETHLELLDLPMGGYELMVRCRSDKIHMLVIMLVTAIAVMTFLIIGFGLIPQGKRIKAYLLSPIPKPRIRGLDPMLIKKGKIDEINQHFSTFHGYKPPQYCMETWYQVSLEASPAAALNGLMSYFKQEDIADPQHQPFLQTNQSPALYCRTPAEQASSYCRTSAEVDKPPQNTPEPQPDPSHTHPELLSFPGMDYSMIVNPAPAESAVRQHSPLDFYTCVGEMTPGGAVRLVPCLPETMKSTSYLQFKDGAAEPDKSIQLAALLKRQLEEMIGADDTGDTTDQRECDVPLLPHSDDKH